MIRYVRFPVYNFRLIDLASKRYFRRQFVISYSGLSLLLQDDRLTDAELTEWERSHAGFDTEELYKWIGLQY